MLLLLLLTGISVAASRDGREPEDGRRLGALPAEIRVMGIFPQSGGWPGGVAAIPAFELALEEINADPDLLPDTVLVGVTADDACTKSGGITAPLTQCGPLSENTGCTDKYFDVIVGSGCSSSCESTARLAEAWQVPQISWACTSPSLSNINEYPWFVRAVSSNRIIVDTALSVMKDKGWKHLGSIVEAEGLFLSTRDYLLNAAENYNVTIAADESFAPAANEADTAAIIRARLEAIKRTGVRVWSTGAYAINTRLILKEAAKLGMTADGWQVIMMGSIEDCLLANPSCPAADGTTIRETDAEVLAAARGSISFLPSKATGPLYEAYVTKMLARDDTGDSPDQLLSWAVYAYEATHSVAHALHAFGENPREDREGFYEAIKAVAFDGPSGYYAYDANGDRAQKYDIVNFQWDDYNADIGTGDVPWTTVATFELLGENAGVTYTNPIQYTAGQTSPPDAFPPPPAWQYKDACPLSDYRLASNTTFPLGAAALSGETLANGEACGETYNLADSTTRLVTTLLMVFNITLAVCFLGWTVVNFKSKVVKASQSVFLLIVSAGAIISSLTTIFLSMDDEGEDMANGLGWRSDGNPSSAGCMLSVWFYSLGFTLTFAPLFVKLWRVKKIFTDKALKFVRITNRQLFAMLGAIVMVDSIIILLWTMADPLLYVRKITATFVDDQGDEYVLSSVGLCESDGAWNYLSLLAAFHVALLVYGNVLSYQTRSVPTKFSEGKYIGLAMLSNFQVLVLSVPILYIVSDNATTNLFIRAGVVFLNDSSTQCLIFVPKIYAHMFPEQFAADMVTSKTNTSSYNSKTSETNK